MPILSCLLRMTSVTHWMGKRMESVAFIGKRRHNQCPTRYIVQHQNPRGLDAVPCPMMIALLRYASCCYPPHVVRSWLNCWQNYKGRCREIEVIHGNQLFNHHHGDGLWLSWKSIIVRCTMQNGRALHFMMLSSPPATPRRWSCRAYCPRGEATGRRRVIALLLCVAVSLFAACWWSSLHSKCVCLGWHHILKALHNYQLWTTKINYLINIQLDNCVPTVCGYSTIVWILGVHITKIRASCWKQGVVCTGCS